MFCYLGVAGTPCGVIRSKFVSLVFLLKVLQNRNSLIYVSPCSWHLNAVASDSVYIRCPVTQQNLCSPYFRNFLKVASFLVKLPNPPGGCSQWQSKTVAWREGKCRARANNQFYIHDNSPGDIPKKTPRNIRNFDNTKLPIRKYCTSNFVLHYSPRILGCKKGSNQTTTILIRSIATGN